MSNLKYLIYTATIYINYVFSPILALTGRRHEIDSGDNTWALAVGVAFVISMLCSIKSILEKKRLGLGSNQILFPLVFFLFAFLVEYGFFPNSGISGFTSYPITRWFVLSSLYVCVDVCFE